MSAVFSAVADALAEGETVTIAGGSALAARTRATRQSPNRRTGRSIAIPASYAPGFKAATSPRQRLRCAWADGSVNVAEV